MNTNDILREYLKRQRKYANFFDWHKKDEKELGIIETLFESMKLHGINTFQNLRISQKDPPDCIAEDQSGNLIGIEVCELVDEEVVRLNAQGKNVYRDWTIDEIVKQLEMIIDEKDYKLFHGGPYKKLILIIHTDEFVINFQTLQPILETYQFKKTNQITEAYLLFSYDPEIGHRYCTTYCPYIQLKISAK